MVIAAAVTVGAVLNSRDAHTTSAPGTYEAVAWLPLGDTHAQALRVRSECGATQGAASVSGLGRSNAHLTVGELVFSVKMKWGPDDARSTSLLDCLNGTHIDHYTIPS
jgi:hypothetical protein